MFSKDLEKNYQSPCIKMIQLKNASIICQSGTEQYQPVDYNPWDINN